MTTVWDKIELLAQDIEELFHQSGEPLPDDVSSYSWHNKLYNSRRYRRAHVQIIDKRTTDKIYIVHATVFPHYNDPSPIWGFDAVCGQNKITGAFLDFSPAGVRTHPMIERFGTIVENYNWSRPRDLPEWAQAIFSEKMVAVGNLQVGEELDYFCDLVKNTLIYYLAHVGDTQQDITDYHMAQNRYCRYQKQNPHVVRSMVSMGVEEQVIRRFVEEIQYPEIA